MRAGSTYYKFRGFGNEMAAEKVPTEAVRPASAKPNMQAGEDGTDSSGWPQSSGDGLGVNEMAAAKPARQAAGCDAA